MSRIKVLLPILTIIVLGLVAVNVNAQAPVITTQPNQIIKCAGNASSMTVVATGAEPLHYQWYQDGSPVGTDSPTIDFPSLTPAEEGTYICNVSNGEGNVDTDPRDVIVVETAPSVTDVTTENDLVCIGTDNLIEVTYDGEYAAVTWYVLSDIVGYTNQLQITDAQLEDEGAYYCMVTNVCGQDISETVSIDIVEPVNITIQPTTQTICEGEDATFTTTSEGDYINYLWLADESMMAGETDPSLTITAPSYPHSIEYKMVAYNVCNNDTSNGVYVNINTYPEITGQPIDMQECFGSDVTLYAFATGTTESFYQWYDENNDPITDETNTSLVVSLVANDTAHYYCEITNVCGTVYTDTSEVITLMPPIVTQQPVGATLCVGDNITLQAKASGSDPLSYQWLFEGSDVIGGNISGDESQNMTITSITAGQSGTYTCHISNVCGFVLSDDAEVTVNTPPLVNMQPEDMVVCEGENLLIDIVTSGTEPITYEWYLEETATLLANTEDYSTDYADPTDSGSYYCLLTNSCAEVSTDTVDITILALPQITTQPEDESVCVGEYASMTIEATGAEPLDYLWYRNESSVSGQTNNMLEYPAAQVNQTGTYFCRVSNICGYEDSETAELSIGTEPAITWNPIDQTICEHDTLNLIMDAQGENFTIQWYFNDSPLPGENDTVLNIINIGSGMQGEYHCIAYNSCAVVSTDTVDVVINPAPIMTLGDDIDLCEGIDTVIGPEGSYVHYNWNNGFSYQPTLEVQLGGTFILEVTGENSCKTVDTLIVEFHPYHDILFGSEDIAACGPYTLDAGDGGYEYTWNTTPPETGSSVYITESGTYAVTVTGDDFGCSTSESVYVDVREPIDIDLGNDQTEPVSGYVDIGIEAIYSNYLWSNGFEGPVQSIYGSTYGVGDHEFWLTAIADNGCTDTDTIIVTFWDDSGISEFEGESLLSIYPNPSHGVITLSSESNTIDGVSVFNITGELIETFAIKNNEISLDLSNFAKGIYILKTKCDDIIITKKILIQ